MNKKKKRKSSKSGRILSALINLSAVLIYSFLYLDKRKRTLVAIKGEEKVKLLYSADEQKSNSL